MATDADFSSALNGVLAANEVFAGRGR